MKKREVSIKYGHNAEIQYISMENLFFHSNETIFSSPKSISEFLSLLKNLLLELNEGLYCFFIKRDLCFFDPHVGDSACQLRAMILNDFYLDKCLMHEYKKNQYTLYFKQFLKKIDLLINQITQFKIRELKQISDVIFNDFKLPMKFLILFYCYFLSKNSATTSLATTCIDVDKVKTSYNISKKQAKKLIHHIQKLLSNFSCEYLINEYSMHPLCYLPIDLIRKLNFTDLDCRPVLPCFLSMICILQKISNAGWDVIFNISLLSQGKIYVIPFKVDLINSNYKIISNELSNYNKQDAFYSFDIEVESDLSASFFINKFIKFKPLDLILAYMAAHPQYPNSRFVNEFLTAISSQSEIKLLYDKYNKLAENEGCTISNKRLFFIKHISYQNYSNLTLLNQKQYIINQNKMKHSVIYG